MLWDIFCKVIDNHGDIGVCWRLSSQLAARGGQVRLWVDDPSALDWMAPGGQAGVQVSRWDGAPRVVPGDAVIEAFGGELDEAWIAAIARKTAAQGRQPAWINLEYLTAETFAHPNLPSGTLGFYFEIDLGATQGLERIILIGRGDGCCIERLSRYQVEMRADNGGQAGAVNWVGIMRADGSYPVAGGSDTVVAADGTGSFAGRFLRIVNVSQAKGTC